MVTIKNNRDTHESLYEHNLNFRVIHPLNAQKMPFMRHYVTSHASLAFIHSFVFKYTNITLGDMLSADEKHGVLELYVQRCTSVWKHLTQISVNYYVFFIFHSPFWGQLFLFSAAGFSNLCNKMCLMNQISRDLHYLLQYGENYGGGLIQTRLLSKIRQCSKMDAFLQLV